ncbi:2-dehydro-3-deoxy-D-gluconate 5-dehydrogenase [compost metagenome]
MNELNFENKTVLVVGGSSGIGNGIAQAFRRKGASVHVWGTRARASDYGDSEDSRLEGLHYAQVDVSQMKSIEQWKAPFEHLDVLVLSQGMVLYEKGEYKIDGFRHVIDVNLNSLMACADKFHPMLKASAGSLIVISSTAAFHSTRGNPAYNASKAGAVGLTRTLGDAWAPDGIRVNGIAPGMVATKMTKATTDHPHRLEAMLQNIPMRRLGTIDEMSGVALFLASPLATYIVGQTIPVDGGLVLR